MKPVIGIVPLIDIGRESYWMLPGYMKVVEEAGGLPIMLPLTERKEDIAQLVDCCDGFVFTGGHDVSPEVYGEEKEEVCGECCPERDCMETALLKKVLKADKPVFGICRGFQLINAVLGGTLYQDLPSQRQSHLSHRQPAPYDLPSHKVLFDEKSPLRELIGKDSMMVNSCHHQGVKVLAPEAVSMASAEDGLVEALFLPEHKFVWAVQWHPEFIYKKDDNAVKIIRAFVEKCK